MTDNVNFTAKYIQPTQVKKFDLTKMKFINKDVSVVEIEPDKLSDISAVSNCVLNWKKDKYGKYIANKLRQEYPTTIEKNDCNIFAVTSQKDSFDKLEHKKILSLAEMSKEKDGKVHLVLLQVKPSISHSACFRKIKGVGRALLNFLKEKYAGKDISLISDTKVTKFYKKNGFTTLDESTFLCKAKK